MNLRLRAWLPKAKMMTKNIEKDDDLNDIIQENNNEGKCFILMQNIGIQDKFNNDIFEEDYLLYETETLRNFMKVKRGKIEFSFYKWDKSNKRWKRTTYQGVEEYATIIGNHYEGIKSKRLYNEMQDLGINI